MLAACTDRTNTLIVSVATIWEIQTKMEAERRKAVQTPAYQPAFQVGVEVRISAEEHVPEETQVLVRMA